MTYHCLKLSTRYYDSVDNGTKPFEVRKDDRSFRIGDTIEFMRVDENGNTIQNGKGTNDYSVKKITFILTHEDFPQGISEGYVVLGLTDAFRTKIL